MALAVESGGIRVVGPVGTSGERVGRALERGGRLGDAGAAGEELAQALTGPPLGPPPAPPEPVVVAPRFTG